MKEVPLSKGFVALVDDEDYERVMQVKWYALTAPGRPTRAHNRKMGLMHRFILRTELDVGHKDLNLLNNQKHNLRPATKQQNAHNRPVHKNNKSGLKGAFKHHGRWKSEIRSRGVTYKLGVFESAQEAHEAYTAAAKRLNGEFARN